MNSAKLSRGNDPSDATKRNESVFSERGHAFVAASTRIRAKRGSPLSSDLRSNRTRCARPPGAVNSPVRTRLNVIGPRDDPKICRNNNVVVPVDPFAGTRRDGKTTTGRAGDVRRDRWLRCRGDGGGGGGGDCCWRRRPRFNYPQRPQNTGIDFRGADGAKGVGQRSGTRV